MQVVYRSLEKHGFSVGALHGDLDQRARMAALDAFRNDQVQLLVCSDVAARGLDIPDVSHVINYDAPHHSEDYVHRIGRTGRAGKTGVALTIVTRADQKSIVEIEKLIARKIDWQEGAVMPSEDEAEAPSRERRGARGGRHRGESREERPKPDRHPERGAESRRHHAERPAQERVAAEQERASSRPRHVERPAKERVAAQLEPASPPPPRSAPLRRPVPAPGRRSTAPRRRARDRPRRPCAGLSLAPRAEARTASA